MEKLEKILRVVKCVPFVLYAICVVYGFIVQIIESDLLHAFVFLGFHGMMLFVFTCIMKMMSEDEDKKVKEKLESED